MLQRTIFTEDHHLYRAAAREFFEREVAPFHDEWEAVGSVPRELWELAGAQGHLAHTVAEEYGGADVAVHGFIKVIAVKTRRMLMACQLNTLIRRSLEGFSLRLFIIDSYILCRGHMMSYFYFTFQPPEIWS